MEFMTGPVPKAGPDFYERSLHRARTKSGPPMPPGLTPFKERSLRRTEEELLLVSERRVGYRIEHKGAERPIEADERAKDELQAREKLFRAALRALPEQEAHDTVNRLAQDQAHGALAAAAKELGANESTVRSRWASQFQKICTELGVADCTNDTSTAEREARAEELRRRLREHDKAEREATKQSEAAGKAERRTAKEKLQAIGVKPTQAQRDDEYLRKMDAARFSWNADLKHEIVVTPFGGALTCGSEAGHQTDEYAETRGHQNFNHAEADAYQRGTYSRDHLCD